MSKYEELSRLACMYVASTQALKEQCRAFCGDLSIAISEYLEVPAGKLTFSKLNLNMEVEDYCYGFGSHPDVIRGKDGFWYFGLTIKWEDKDSNFWLDETWKIGVSKNSDSYVIRIGDKDYYAQASGDYNEICEALYSEDKDQFMGPVTNPPRRIGFQ